MAVAGNTSEVNLGHKYSVDASITYRVDPNLPDSERETITPDCFKVQDEVITFRQDEIAWLDSETFQVDFIWNFQDVSVAEAEKTVADQLIGKVKITHQCLIQPVDVCVLGSYNDLSGTWETEY